MTVNTVQSLTDYKLSVQGKILTVGQQFQLEPGLVYLRLKQDLPARTTLRQNYPNPFNPETWVPYDLAKEAEVRLNIYSSRGFLLRQINLG